VVFFSIWLFRRLGKTNCGKSSWMPYAVISPVIAYAYTSVWEIPVAVILTATAVYMHAIMVIFDEHSM